MILNVMDFPGTIDDPLGVKQALDVAEDGDVIYLPSGLYTSPANGWQISKSLEIRGDGRGAGQTSGSVIKAASRDGSIFEVVAPSAAVYFHDLQLQAADGASGNGVGIRCLSDADKSVSGLKLKGIAANGFATNGVEIVGFAGSPTQDPVPVEDVMICDCVFTGCSSSGMFLKNVSGAHISTCTFQDNGFGGLLAEQCLVAVYASTFDGNGFIASSGIQGNLRFFNCLTAKAEACRFLNFKVGVAKRGCVIDGGVAHVGSCYFDSGDSAGVGSGIVLTRSTAGQPYAGPVTVFGNRFAKTATLISVDSAVMDCVILAQYDEDNGVISLPQPNNGMVAAPHIIRDSSSAITALILPSAASDPSTGLVDGMIAYNTTLNKVRVRLGGQWKSVKTLL